MLLTMRLEFY